MSGGAPTFGRHQTTVVSGVERQGVSQHAHIQVLGLSTLYILVLNGISEENVLFYLNGIRG